MPYDPNVIRGHLAWQWSEQYILMRKALIYYSEPGPGPDRALNVIWRGQAHSPDVQGMYGDFVMDNGIPPFFELVLSAAMYGGPINFDAINGYLDYYSHTNPPWYQQIKESFTHNDTFHNVIGLSLLHQAADPDQSQRPDTISHEYLRAHYRDDRNSFIQTLNSW